MNNINIYRQQSNLNADDDGYYQLYDDYGNQPHDNHLKFETQAAMNLDGAAYGLTLFLIGQVCKHHHLCHQHCHRHHIASPSPLHGQHILWSELYGWLAQ